MRFRGRPTRDCLETVPLNGNSGIFALQVGGSELRQLTEDRDYDLIWSPDGSQFGFARLRASDGVADIYVTDVACAETTGGCSSALRNLTRSSETDDRYPVWSPSGRQIAVVSWGWRMRMAYVPIIDVDGSNARGLIRLARNGYAPSGVELTGRLMAFLAVRASWENHEKVYIVDLATGQPNLVASNDYSINASAAWRP
jgi:Tol biopolymer transport system component